ncbi:unnamed protein product [Brassica oleracea]|uniref:(rape) hypothetical protein n=1 Tax=Brassica napus TaxID=3708 RepID=A0A816HXE2_BRANA|nr:unnamed protein product [Brassica napus]
MRGTHCKIGRVNTPTHYFWVIFHFKISCFIFICFVSAYRSIKLSCDSAYSVTE